MADPLGSCLLGPGPAISQLPCSAQPGANRGEGFALKPSLIVPALSLC